MRKFMMAVMAVAGLGLAAGCQDRNKEVQEQRQDVAEAEREAAQRSGEIQRETQQEVAEAQREGTEEQQEVRQDVAEEQRELAEAQREQAEGQYRDTGDEATGGSGTAATVKTEEVKGTIQSASASNITILVPDKNNQMMRFQASPQVQVMRDDKPVALSDLKPGDEVRASYQMDPNGQMLLRSIDVTKQSAQHPGKQKK
jgi:hypothetical protein